VVILANCPYCSPGNCCLICGGFSHVMFRWVDHLGGIANSQPYCDRQAYKTTIALHFDLGVFDFMFAWPYPHPIPFPLCSVWDLQSNFELRMIKLSKKILSCLIYIVCPSGLQPRRMPSAGHTFIPISLQTHAERVMLRCCVNVNL